MTFTPEDPRALTGCFKVFDTYGFPLEEQITEARERGLGISLPNFFEDAINAGWPKETALTYIKEQVAFVDGGDVDNNCIYMIEALQ